MRKATRHEYTQTYHTLFAKLCLVVVAYIFLYYSYLGLTSPITPGDSTGYHIPIARSILDGSFLHPRTHEFAVNPVMYYPGSSDAILSVFMILSVPLNLYNILGLCFLFFACYLLANEYFSRQSLSIVFASAVVTLPVMQQWVITQFVDYWFAAFFVLLLYLLQKPKKTVKYVLLLGMCAGLLIGTKYSGPFILFILFGVYVANLRRIFSFKKALIFMFITFIAGGFWYMRNLLFTGNPYFPQNLLTHDKDFLKFKVLDSIVLHPTMMFDALISQYASWSFVLVLVPVGLFVLYKKMSNVEKSHVLKLTLVAVLSFVVFLILPSEPGSYTHYVSTYRYSLTMFVPLILVVFILADIYKTYVLLYLFTFISFLSVPQITYHPKIVFLLLPIAYIIAVYPKIPVFKKIS